MDQKKIGHFISMLRKEKGLTQKELAGQIGISDKTISKWETGNGLPDIEMLTPLCQILEINVNELLSGEKLPPNEYSEKAEENMMNLLKENEVNRKSYAKQNIIGCVLGVIAIVFLGGISTGFHENFLIWYIDLPSMVELALLCLTCVILSGAKGKEEIIEVLKKIIIPAAVFVTLFALVIVLTKLDDLETIGPNLAVAILTLLYSILGYIILEIISYRRKNR